MNISVTFRNSEGENWQKTYVEERIEKLKKYLDAPAEAHIILSTEKFRNVVEINLSANGWNVNAKEEAKDMHLAVDSCIDKIEKQLKKQKEKIQRAQAQKYPSCGQEGGGRPGRGRLCGSKSGGNPQGRLKTHVVGRSGSGDGRQ